MSIRKLVVAAALAAVGAAAHAGPMSSGATGKDVFNITDSVFSTKPFGTQRAAAAAPASPAAAAPSAAPVAAPISEAADAGNGAIVITPPEAGTIGGGASVTLPLPAQLNAELVLPAADPADVPEPASMALMLAGMIGVGAMRRRKQQH